MVTGFEERSSRNKRDWVRINRRKGTVDVEEAIGEMRVGVALASRTAAVRTTGGRQFALFAPRVTAISICDDTNLSCFRYSLLRKV